MICHDENCNSKLVRCYDHEALYCPSPDELKEYAEESNQSIEDAYKDRGIDRDIHMMFKCDECGDEWGEGFEINVPD